MKHLTDLELIERQCHSDEVLAEYKQHGNLTLAIRTVSQRHVVSREQQRQEIERLMRAYEARVRK